MIASFGTTRLADRLIRSLPVNRWYDDRSRPRIAARFFGPGSKPIKSSSPRMSWFSANRISKRGLRRATGTLDASPAPTVFPTVFGSFPFDGVGSGCGAGVQPMSATCPEVAAAVETIECDTISARISLVDRVDDSLVVAVS